MKLYIIDNSTNINIIKSQHLIPLKLKKNKDGYVLLCPKKLVAILNDYGLHDQTKYYRSNFEKYLLIFKIKNITEIYTRSIIDFFWILFFKTILMRKWNLAFDFRGLSSAEGSFRGKSKIKVLILECLEWVAYNYSDRLFTVSKKFKSYLETKYTTRKNITVIPCCVENSVFVSKPTYTTGDKLNFLYVGGLSTWQKFEYILTVYGIISKKMNSSLTIITNEVSQAEGILKVKGVDAKVFRMDHKNISLELTKYDFGFLFRDNILLNNVASPVKFLEYISNGVIPIISENIGDYSELVISNKIGIIETPNINKMIEDIVNIKKDFNIQYRLFNTAKKYTWKNYIDQLF